MSELAELEERVLTLEIWKGRVDADLNGRPGTQEPGLIREYREAKAEKRGREKLTHLLLSVLVALNGLVGLIVAIDHLKSLLK